MSCPRAVVRVWEFSFGCVSQDQGSGDLYGAVFRARFAARHNEKEIAVRDEGGHSSVVQTVCDS